MFVWQKIALDKLLVRLHKMYDAIGQATQTTIDPATKVEKIETVMGKLECKSCCTLNKPVAFSLPVIFLRFSFIEEVRSLLFKQNCDLLSFLTNATTENYVIMKLCYTAVISKTANGSVSLNYVSFCASS